MTESVDTLRDFLDGRLGDSSAIEIEAMVGGGSCEIFALQRGRERWVLRHARHASSATAHDVLREFRILDAIKDEAVSIARPILACDDPDVFGAPFYVMARIDGAGARRDPIGLDSEPARAVAGARSTGRRTRGDSHAVDWQRRGLGDLARSGPYLARQVDRWMSQLDSYHGRPLPSAAPASQRTCTSPTMKIRYLPFAAGDYKLDNVLFAPDAPPQLRGGRLGDVIHRGPADRSRLGHDFPSRTGGDDPLGVAASPGFDRSQMPTRSLLIRRVTRNVPVATLAGSIGTTCSPAGSWPSS